jgi:hypothetical protein
VTCPPNPPPDAPQFSVTPPGRVVPLRRNRQGFPIPFFVADQSSPNPDFRVAGRPQFRAAVRAARCWVCGNPRRGGVAAFVIGPMCAVNRVSADPPSHPECAEYSVKVCPFLSRPQMRRRAAGIKHTVNSMAGIPILRNPGVSVIWVCRQWQLTKIDNGWIFDLGEPSTVSWWMQGRPAQRVEVLVAFESGMPLLRKQCENQQDRDDLAAAYQQAVALAPTD